ncbi:hypothetical protein C5167_012395 [Papaver somniferum]|uniref:Uncharacterized protein n=1 Tax=Papaver somniferum TaxID=3469 RepID=A0A4Y7J1A3_PAPSO|nr:uncharacterized protein LOC113355574 [Papaver somniferum]RZC53538.1 hypothetical protein C5167_012395 [Papaver somniferum]
MASATAAKLFLFSSVLPINSSSKSTKAIPALKFFFPSTKNYNFKLINSHSFRPYSNASKTTLITNTISDKSKSKKKKKTEKGSSPSSSSSSGGGGGGEEKLKRRTRSQRVFEIPEDFHHQLVIHGENSKLNSHIPVMLGEVLEVFEKHPSPLRSFVDCTLGAAGHSSAIISAHPELELLVGLDVDPKAHEKAKLHINDVLNLNEQASALKVITRLKNFKDIKSVLSEVDEKILTHGVDGILMDLGMSSMQVNNAERGFSVLCDGPLDMRMDPQATLRAEDILNSWPEAEVGRILRDYGEESNWYSLQNKIVKARSYGGLHSTGELGNLIRGSTPQSAGRQGWMKTATRVFQALRIAVNDELKILEDTLYACFDSLSPGGRLAVISFHSLEDRIVKKTFLDIIEVGDGNGLLKEEKIITKREEDEVKETWIKQKIVGRKGINLTKRPITPCEEEERLNRRCRSAKLRVIQKF